MMLNGPSLLQSPFGQHASPTYGGLVQSGGETFDCHPTEGKLRDHLSTMPGLCERPFMDGLCWSDVRRFSEKGTHANRFDILRYSR